MLGKTMRFYLFIVIGDFDLAITIEVSPSLSNTYELEETTARTKYQCIFGLFIFV